jgi:carbon-monoxide dehydrogenase medium subunit
MKSKGLLLALSNRLGISNDPRSSEESSRLFGMLSMRWRPQVEIWEPLETFASAVPSADTAPPLIALGASVRLLGAKGEGPRESFFKGPGESVLKADEILVEVLVPNPPENSGGGYFKLMRRNAMDLALVGAAVFLQINKGKKVCQEARIALGAVAPTPMRARKAEQVLVGRAVSEETAKEAGNTARLEAKPISDIRASEAYRRDMVGVLTKRAIMAALDRTR